MPNPFDQFDRRARPTNPFDQFDRPAVPSTLETTADVAKAMGGTAAGALVGSPEGHQAPPGFSMGLSTRSAPIDLGGAKRPLELGVQAVGRGLADILGAPVDIVSSLGNLGLSTADWVSGGNVPQRIQEPFMGSDWIANRAAPAAESLGIDVRDPSEMTPAERLAYGAQRFGTQALTAGSALASSAGQAAANLPGALGRLFDTLGKAYRGGGQPIAGDVAAGLGVGTADAATDEYAPEWLRESPVGRVVIDALGGLGGATIGALTQGGASALGRAIKGVIVGNQARDLPRNTATGDFFSKTDVDAAAARAQGLASNPQNAARTIGETVDSLSPYGSPASMPTTGIASNDVGLIVAENAARRQNSVPFIERDQAVNSRAREQVDNLAPNASGRQFTDAIENVQQNRVREAQAALGSTEDQMQAVDAIGAELADQIAPMRGRREDAAGRIDENVVDQTLRPQQEASSRLFGQVDPERKAVVDVTPLQDAARRVRDTLGDFNDPTKVLPGGLLARIEGRVDPEIGAAPPTSVGDIVAVYPEISQTIDRARRQGNYTLADNLGSLRTAMDELLQSAAASGNDAAQRALDARQNYADTLGQTFGAGGPSPVARDLRRDFNLDRVNRQFAPASQTAGKFLRPGQPERAQALQNIVRASADPAGGQQAVRDYLISDLASSGVVDPKTGSLRPNALRKWRDEWGAALDTAPGVRNEVDAMLNAAQTGQTLRSRLSNDARDAAQRLTDVQRNTGALRFVLGNDPPAAIASIFSSGDPERAMAEIVQTVGTNESAREGLKAAVREYLIERGTNAAPQKTRDSAANPVSFARLDGLFAQNERTLAQVFTPEEMNSLRAAHAFLKPFANRAVQATTGSQTAERFANDFWKFAEIGLKARYGILKGGGILRTLRLWANTLPSNKEAVDQIMTQMWFDPDLARHLLTKDTGADTPQWNRRLLNLLAVGAGSRQSVGAGPPETPAN